MSAPTPEESWRTLVSNQIKLALVEWTPSLFDQPTQPPFRYNAKFKTQRGANRSPYRNGCVDHVGLDRSDESI